ncbi:LOW QUALITY PROTEIN: group 3 secretory phospholipase A2 [Patagioenas fasciata]|uniref:LOW QUALITY PROTEIN: group 3 secretory phospholipase A2 n=1 Tax=Patagioenas fasciata TaxID=372321 RepID=UPI003A995949
MEVPVPMQPGLPRKPARGCVAARDGAQAVGTPPAAVGPAAPAGTAGKNPSPSAPARLPSVPRPPPDNHQREAAPGREEPPAPPLPWSRCARHPALASGGARGRNRAEPNRAERAERSRTGAGGSRYMAFLSGGSGPGAVLESDWAARRRLRPPPPEPRCDGTWRRRAVCTDLALPGGGPRRRRGWTLPGTLCCGAGNSAGNASELGLFHGPDRCCRDHDQCSAQITALQLNYGIRNYRLRTVSHCDARCAGRGGTHQVRQCLLALNDTISSIIGVTFFNLLEVPCFVLEESGECVQRHWWGGCERYGVVLLARMVQQSQYHYGLPVQEQPSCTAPGKGRKSFRAGCKRLGLALGQNPGLRRAQRPATAQQLQGVGTLSPSSTVDKAEPSTRHPAAQWGLEPDPPTAMTLLEQDLAGGKPRVCRCYKYLDKCKHQIVPHEVKCELHNVDSQALFHCNRTHRCVPRRKRLCFYHQYRVAVLADRIAIHCFALKPLTDCSPGKEPQHNCITVTWAVLVHAKHLRKTMRHWGPPHVTSRDKHPDWNMQDSGCTLYEQCLQLPLEQKPSAWPSAVP